MLDRVPDFQILRTRIRFSPNICRRSSGKFLLMGFSPGFSPFSPFSSERNFNQVTHVEDNVLGTVLLYYTAYLVAPSIKQEHDGHQTERPVVPEDLDLVGPVGDASVAEISAAALKVRVNQESVAGTLVTYH